TFLAVALRLMSPVKSVSNYPAVMAGAAASAERVFEVLDLPADEGDRPGETTAVFRERFEYRHVSFAYGEEAEVLRDVSLAVRRGPGTPTTPRRGPPRAATPPAASAARGSRAASASASRSRAPCCATRRSSSSTRPPASSTPNRNGSFRTRSTASCSTARCS